MANENQITVNALRVFCRNGDGVGNEVTVRQLRDFLNLCPEDELDSALNIRVSSYTSRESFTARVHDITRGEWGLQVSAAFPKGITISQRREK